MGPGNQLEKERHLERPLIHAHLMEFLLATLNSLEDISLMWLSLLSMKKIGSVSICLLIYQRTLIFDVSDKLIEQHTLSVAILSLCFFALDGFH
jgi:hypothetical protein